MTVYRVPVSKELLEARDVWPRLEGFELLSVDGPWPKYPLATICTFSDEHAPKHLEGKLVNLDVHDSGGVLRVVSWTEIPFPGPLPAPASA